jgi:hypothetical protein
LLALLASWQLLSRARNVPLCLSLSSTSTTTKFPRYSYLIQHLNLLFPRPVLCHIATLARPRAGRFRRRGHQALVAPCSSAMLVCCMHAVAGMWVYFPWSPEPSLAPSRLWRRKQIRLSDCRHENIAQLVSLDFQWSARYTSETSFGGTSFRPCPPDYLSGLGGGGPTGSCMSHDLDDLFSEASRSALLVGSPWATVLPRRHIAATAMMPCTSRNHVSRPIAEHAPHASRNRERRERESRIQSSRETSI